MSSNTPWNSPLGIAVILFLLYGAFYILIGILTPFGSESSMGQQILIVSMQADESLFKGKPDKLLGQFPQLALLRRILVRIIAGLLTTAGFLIIMVTWFGLKQAQIWAITTLTIAGMGVLPYWWLSLKPYLDDHIPLTLGDLPPFMWVTAALYVPACILGWIGVIG